MIQSYKKKHELADSYDAICIGSGLGSLTTAAILAKEGQRVLVLERHYTAGGFTHIFKRRGYEWDVGIHYIGEVHREKSVLRKLFDYITEGQLQWADMGAIYDRIVIGDRIYDFPKGVGNFIDQLIEYFPQEEQAIREYVDLVFQVTKTSRNFYLEKAMPAWASRISGNFMRRPFLRFARRTTLDVLEELTDNQELIKVLTGQYGDYGLPPAQSSFAMHASLVRHFFDGGNFPVGGSSSIVNTIDPVIEKAGGTILISAEVAEVIVENKTAVGVRMADGTEFRAAKVISGAGVVTTYSQLLPAEEQLQTLLQKVQPSVAHACLYIGLKGSPDELNLPKANYWIYPDQGSHDEVVAAYQQDITQAFPVVYISFPAAKDPDWSKRYPDRSTIDIITLLPYQAVAQWADTSWMKRGEDYEVLKEQISQRLLEHLFRWAPHLRDHIDCYELSTPFTTRHFTNYQQGEIYGLDHGPARFELTGLRPQTQVRNFYLTGQDIITAGIGGALFSGLLTSSAITRKNLLSKIMG